MSIKKKLQKDQSRFDPTRKNVGAIYSDLKAKKSATPDRIQFGDFNGEILKGWLEDINLALTDNPFSDRPFYVRIVEERDMQMKDAIHRGVTRLLYRPWPEDNTTVFWVDPKTQQIKFCWDLPHHSEIPNIMSHANEYPKEYLRGIIAWKKGLMDFFGFEFIGDYKRWSALVEQHSAIFSKEDLKPSEVAEDLRKQIQEAGGWHPKEKQTRDLVIKT